MQTCAGSDFDYGTNNFKSSSGARRGIHAASRNTQRNLILNRFRNSAAKTPSVGLEQLFPVVTRNGSGEGCLDATLNDCLRGSYAHAPAAPDHTTTTTINAMDSLTPKIIPSKIPNSETGKVDTLAPESDRAGRGGLMRVEGRHHLVDIHGLAVFLRRSTRCLSCRAAFCLYVTGTISAQLAAVTQVKITCQKCHYTTSQTLSRPSSAPDEPCAQPSPSVSAPPLDARSPLPTSPAAHPHKPRHQTVIKLLKEESSAASESQLKAQKEACLWPPTSDSTPGNLPSALPLPLLRPIESVWVKEEGKSPPSTKAGQCEGEALPSLEPLLAEWCPWVGDVGSTSTPPPHSHLQGNKTPPRPHGTLTDTSSAALSCSLGKPQTIPDSGDAPLDATTLTSTTSPGIDPLHVAPEEGALSQVASLSTSLNSGLSAASNPCSTALSPSESLFINPATSVLTVLSSTPTHLPYGLPLSSSLLQPDTTTNDPSQLLQTFDIKQRLERDLEESLRLVRRMIQLGPDTPPTGDRKKDTKTDGSKSSLCGLSDDAMIGNLCQSRGSVPFCSLPTDAGEQNSGGQAKERDKITASGRNKNKPVKRSEDTSVKAGKVKGGKGRKRGGGEESEKSEKKRRKSAKVSEELVGRQDPPQRALQTERECHFVVEQDLYDMLKKSLGAGKDAGRVQATEGREWQSGQCSGAPLRPCRPLPASHPSHPFCRCCSGPQIPSNATPTIQSLKSGLETLGNIRKLLDETSSKRRQRKGTTTPRPTIPHPSPSAQLTDALPRRDTNNTTGTKDGTTSIPDHVFTSLQRNYNHFMHRNSLKMAIKSLMKKNMARNHRSRKYVKISVGVGGEEAGVSEGVGRVGRGGEGSVEEGGGAVSSWRFHDLLSSDSGSDSEDGKLIIDTDL